MKKNIYLFSLYFLTIGLLGCSQLNSYLPKNSTPAKEFFKAAWAKNLDPVFDSGNLPIALQSPAVYDGIVYIGDNQGHMNAYELDNGRPVWSVYDGSTYHSTPIVYGDKLIYGTAQGRVVARKIKNGEELVYNVDLGSPIETAGTVYKGKVFFQLRNHQIFCLDVETGKIIWGFKKSISLLTTLQRASTPIVYNNKLYVGFADGNFGAINIEEGILLFETKLSTASKFLDVDANAFFHDGKIYIGPQGSNVVSLDPNSGKIIRRADFQSLRAPILVGDHLIFGTSEGEIAITDKNLTVISKNKISNAAITSLTTFKGRILAGTLNGEVLALSSENLMKVGKFEFGHAYSAIFADLVSAENHLVVLSSRNRLFTFY